MVKNTTTQHDSIKVRNQIKRKPYEYNIVIIIELRFVLPTACRGDSFTYCVEANSFTS